jgi:hypothetical protein
MMVKRLSMLMPSRPTVSRSAMPARTTIPKVVNCRKAKTAPMIDHGEGEIDQAPVGVDDRAPARSPAARRNRSEPAKASGAGVGIGLAP